MDERRARLYQLAVNLLLASLAVILVLAGLYFFREGNPVRGLVFNLSTELAGVVIIFLVANRLFLLDRDRDLLEEIESLRSSLRESFNPLATNETSRDRFNLESLLPRARTVDLLGYNMLDLLRAMREQLAKSISEGASVRILLVDFNSAAGELMRYSLRDPEKLDEDVRNSLKYILLLKEMIRGGAGKFEVKLTAWVPSCSMIIIDGEKEMGVSKIGIHPLALQLPLGRKYRKRLFLFLSRKEYPQEFDYFKTQFDVLWEDKNTSIWDFTLSPSRLRR